MQIRRVQNYSLFIKIIHIERAVLYAIRQLYRGAVPL